MDSLLMNLIFGGLALALCASFLAFDRLLRMETRLPEHQRHSGGRAACFLTVARDMAGAIPNRGDLKAMLLGFRLYVAWLFRAPVWVCSDARARRMLWTMRSLFWLNIIGMEVVKEVLL